MQEVRRAVERPVEVGSKVARRVHTMSFADIAAELNKIPPVTRVVILSSCLVALPVFLHLANPFWYHLDFHQVTSKLQVRRGPVKEC